MISVEFLVGFYSKNATHVTYFLCGLIVIVGSVLMRSNGPRAQLVPSLAVSAGIFFTFLGLAVSLVAVSNHGIQGKFDALLGGLSTAFWTSVVGMGFSMVAKVKLAGRKERSPLHAVKSEVVSVRQEIIGLGQDIKQHLTTALLDSVDQYSQSMSSNLLESSKHIRQTNDAYRSSLENLTKGVEALTDKVQQIVEPTNGVLTAANALGLETQSLLKNNAQLLSLQKSRAEEFEGVLGSIAQLAPEAKSVFEAIDKLNESYEACKNNVAKTLDDNQQRYSKDIDKITSEAINRIVGIEHGQHERITQHLEKIDEAVKQSFDVVMNSYGKGMVELTKKKLEMVAEIIDQLEKAKNAYSSSVDKQDSQRVEGELVTGQEA